MAQSVHHVYGSEVIIRRSDGSHFSLDSLMANDFTNNPSKIWGTIWLHGYLDGAHVSTEGVYPTSSAFARYAPASLVGKELDQLWINIVSSPIDHFGVDDIVLTLEVPEPVSAAGDLFGSSVAISGDRAIVGAPCYGANMGAAYVLERDDSGVWLQKGTLADSDGSVLDSFGSCVSVFGDTVVVGASGDDGTTSKDQFGLTSGFVNLRIKVGSSL